MRDDEQRKTKYTYTTNSTFNTVGVEMKAYSHVKVSSRTKRTVQKFVPNEILV